MTGYGWATAYPRAGRGHLVRLGVLGLAVVAAVGAAQADPPTSAGMTKLRPLAGMTISSAYAIAPNGLVVGVSIDRRHNPWPVMWRGGKVSSLSTSHLLSGTPRAINAAGQIVGAGQWKNGSGWSYQALMWKKDRVTRLVFGSGHAAPSFAWDINDRGRAVGESLDVGAAEFVNGKVKSLGRHPSMARAAAKFINNAGVIAGEAYNDVFHPAHACYWKNGKLTLLPEPGGALGTNITGISEDGTIAGVASYPDDGAKACVWKNGELQPVPEAPGNPPYFGTSAISGQGELLFDLKAYHLAPPELYFSDGKELINVSALVQDEFLLSLSGAAMNDNRGICGTGVFKDGENYFQRAFRIILR